MLKTILISLALLGAFATGVIVVVGVLLVFCGKMFKK